VKKEAYIYHLRKLHNGIIYNTTHHRQNDFEQILGRRLEAKWPC